MPSPIALMSVLAAWRYVDYSRRDLRLDLLRGYCVAVMTIDHVGLFPAWTIAITGGAQLWVTAAEGFVLIAGIVFGMVFGRSSQERGWSWTAARIGRRALLLYGIGAGGHWLLMTIDYLLRLARGLQTNVPTDYFELVQSALFQTRRAPASFDLMPLYTLLMLWGLLALYGLRQKGWRWVALGAAIVWHAARFSPRAYTLFIMGFNFAIWQVLFVLGLIIGCYRPALAAWWASRPWPRLRSAGLILSALAMLIISYQVNVNGLWPEATWLRADELFSRAALAPGRILFTLWLFAGLYQLITVLWQPFNRLLGWLLLPLGQHALTAFVLQALIAYAVMRLPGWPFPEHDPTVMGWLHIGLVLVIWVLTRASVYARQHAQKTTRFAGWAWFQIR